MEVVTDQRERETGTGGRMKKGVREEVCYRDDMHLLSKLPL